MHGRSASVEKQISLFRPFGLPVEMTLLGEGEEGVALRANEPTHVAMLHEWGTRQMLRRILYGVSGLDPLSYAGAIGLLAAIAALAALWPARRALRIDPMEILRHE